MLSDNALQIVLELAEQNVLTDEVCGNERVLKDQQATQTKAIELVRGWVKGEYDMIEGDFNLDPDACVLIKLNRRDKQDESIIYPGPELQLSAHATLALIETAAAMLRRVVELA